VSAGAYASVDASLPLESYAEVACSGGRHAEASQGWVGVSDRQERGSAEGLIRTLGKGSAQVKPAKRHLAETAESGHAIAEVGPQQNTERKQVVQALDRLAQRDECGALVDLLFEHEAAVVEVERILNLIGNDRFARFFGDAHEVAVASEAREHVTSILQSVERVADSPNPESEIAKLARMFLPLSHSSYEAATLDRDTAMVIRRFLLTAQQAREALPMAARLSTVLRQFADKAPLLARIVESLENQHDLANIFESVISLLANAELVGQRADEQQRIASEQAASNMCKQDAGMIPSNESIRVGNRA
jgi:hypothetical protein